MKVKTATTAAVMGLLIALGAGEGFAAQSRGGNGGRTTMSGTGTSATRPAGSQRRDGTFLTTGTTANGSTTRPGNGRGVMDGSRLMTTTAPVTAQ